jgi:hypothetical protein
MISIKQQSADMKRREDTRGVRERGKEGEGE